MALSQEDLASCVQAPDAATDGFYFQQTMYRIKDPKVSLDFYTRVLGMRLMGKFDFESAKFSLYFMGYEDMPKDLPDGEKKLWLFKQKATLELTHNWGTESQDGPVYHNGNSEPRGYGHIGLVVPDVCAACQRFQELGVDFVKKPDDGRMKGIAFIKDPDGYWIEIIDLKHISEAAQSK